MGSWPRAAKKQQHEVLAQLRREVDALRAAPPPFLLRLDTPDTAPLELRSGHLAFPTEASGPWDVDAALQVSTDAVRVRLRFGSRWPREPPSARVLGMQGWPLLDRLRSPPAELLERVTTSTAAAATAATTTEGAGLRATLEGLHGFLLEPVAQLGLEGKAADRARSWVRDVRKLNEGRLSVIRSYMPLAKHRELFEPLGELKQEWFSPELWQAAGSGRWRELLTEHVPGQVYSFPLFTDAFCNVLLEEIFGFYDSGLPARRPNSMNAYGIILNDIGLEPFVDRLQSLLQPLGHQLFPGAGSQWDGHHCFVVRYREGEDLGLDMHTDDSDVTFNVCLGLDFKGAGLQFCGAMGAPDHRQHTYTYQHHKGRCVVHLGRRRHGADDITSGERLNLILWNHGSIYRRSEEYRQPEYAAEAGPPAPLCLSYTHDRDFGVFKPYPDGKEAFRSRGWCPPQAAEYKGFKSDRAETLVQVLGKL